MKWFLFLLKRRQTTDDRPWTTEFVQLTTDDGRQITDLGSLLMFQKIIMQWSVARRQWSFLCLSFACCIMPSFSIYAQHGAEELIQLSDKLIIDGNIDSAAVLLTSAGSIYEEQKEYEDAILCYVKSARHHSYFSVREDAERLLEKAYSIIRKEEVQDPAVIAKVHLIHATHLYMGTWYDSARVELKHAFDLLRKDSVRNLVDISENYILLGKLEYFQNGNYQKSIQILLKALEMLDNRIDEYPYQFWNIYKWLGVNYSSLRDFDQSIGYLQTAVNIILTHYAPYHIYESNVLLSYGGALSYMDKDEEAIKKYKRIETILEHSDVNDPLIRSFMYSNLAMALDSDSTLDESIAYMHKAEEIWMASLDTQNVEVGTLYYNLGDSYNEAGKHRIALNYFKKTLAIEKKYLGMHNPEVAQDYRRIAWCFKNIEELDSALFYIQQSLQAIDPLFTSDKIIDNPTTVEVPLYHELYRSLSDKAEILFDYYERSSQSKYLQYALDTYVILAELLDYTNTRFDFDNSRLLLKERAYDKYRKGIKVACKLGAVTNQKKYYELAWNFAEKSKYSMLTEAFVAHQVSKFDNIPDEILERERALKEEYTREEQKLWKLQHRERDSSISYVDLQNHVFELKQNYVKFQEEIKEQYPDYFRLKYDNSVKTPSELQTHLSPSMACLMYVMMDSSIIIFTVTQDTFTVGEYAPQWLFSDSLTQYIQAVRSNQSDLKVFHSFSYKLFQDLLGTPLAYTRKVDRLILIPDGKLGYLPFDVLLTSEGNASMTYRDLPYVIRDYSLNYAYSSTLWINNMLEDIAVNTSYVGFAPSYDNVSWGDSSYEERNASEFSLAPLKGIYNEVSFAGKLFQGRTYLREQATEDRLKSLNRKPAILHLATHTLIDDVNPLQSRFILSRTDSSAEEDGYLKVFEIYNMRLDSRLAVLSACDTGIGKLYRGEGMMSLSRAFMYAGCPSILTSLWRAKDEPTRQIVQSFFEHIKEGKPKDLSLREAKLSYLSQADPLQAHPANWGTWVIIGSPQRITFQYLSQLGLIPIYILGLLVLVGILVFIRKRLSGNI